MRKRGFRKKTGIFLMMLLILTGTAFRAFAGEGVPIYTFTYQGSVIETYATYSVVDGVQTKGFRYFVKDGELVVIDNRLNTVPDGIFLHFEDGESYEAVLTRGGKLVSLGTVDLTKTLKNLRNKGISGLVSNIETGGTDLVLMYSNGAVVCYDAVSGEELYRIGSFEDSKPGIREYVQEYIDDIISQSTGTGHSQGKIEAEAVVDIMDRNGWKLQDLIDAGVFDDEESLRRFVETGELPEKKTEPEGRTEPEGQVSGNEAEGTGMQAEGDGAPDPAQETGTKTEDMPGAGELPSGERPPSTVPSPEAGTVTPSKAGEEIPKDAVIRNDEAEESEAASVAEEREKAEELRDKGKKIKESSAEESAADGKPKDKTKNGTENGEKKEKNAGEKEKPDGSGKHRERDTGVQETSGQKGAGSAEIQDGGASRSGETGEQDSGLKDGEETEGRRGISGETGKSAEKKLLRPNAGAKYVTVYNPETGSYEIFSVAELLNNPEEPKSENEKLNQTENRKIAELLKARDDETEERGVGLYILIILAVAGLTYLVLVAIKKSHSAGSASGKDRKKQTGGKTIHQEEKE